MSVAFSQKGALVPTPPGDNTEPSSDSLPIRRGKRTSTDMLSVADGARWLVMLDRRGENVLPTASADSTAKMWNAESGERRSTLEGRQGRAMSAAFSQEGALVPTPPEDNTEQL